MSAPIDLQAPEAVEIVNVLGKAFPNVAAYRYNSASLRVRIIDERFRSKTPPERDRMVEPLLESLSEDIQDDITILLLLTPEEVDCSLANFEFEGQRGDRN